MWRPDDWENNWEKEARKTFTSLRDIYESGADAMLEALKKGGEYVDAEKAPHGYVFNHMGSYPRTFKGWFVLIPEEPK